MLAFSYFILKVIIISAVLFGYYWLLLRNKVFHGYNRFYLLGVIILSLSLPLLQINILSDPGQSQTKVIKMLQVVSAGDEYAVQVISARQKQPVSLNQFITISYAAISLVFFVMMLHMILRIRLLLKNNDRIRLNDIELINTDDAPGTPFSFLRYIFWNKRVDLHGEAGKRIFMHELSHIRQHHTLDKLFLNIVHIFFWVNPVFWLIRRELYMIHEFTADRRAVENGDTAAFAEMILASTYPQHRLTLTNNFFYSPIKRRLLMLTKNQHPKMNYISRLLVLPLAVLVFGAFVLKAKIVEKDPAIKQPLAGMENNPALPENPSLNKNDIPSKRTVEVAFTKNPITVIIDAGHGGADMGAKSESGFLEKDLALELSKKIAALNANENVKIILSRESDMYQSPIEKADFASQHKADLFISIHLDASEKSMKDMSTGMSVMISNSEIQHAAKSRLFASAMIGRFKNNYGIGVKELPVQTQISVRVLARNTFPSVLIEAGYISNENDLSYLRSEKGQETFARNVLNAINDFSDSRDFVINKEIPVQDSLGLYKGKIITQISVVEKNNKAIYLLRLATGEKVVLSADEFAALKLKMPPPPPPPAAEVVAAPGKTVPPAPPAAPQITVIGKRLPPPPPPPTPVEAITVQGFKRAVPPVPPAPPEVIVTGRKRVVPPAPPAPPIPAPAPDPEIQKSIEKALRDENIIADQIVYTDDEGSSPVANSPSLISPKILFVIDGVIKDRRFFESIEPKNFSEVRVLKGSKATRKYGVQAEEGVIEIITKKTR